MTKKMTLKMKLKKRKTAILYVRGVDYRIVEYLKAQARGAPMWILFNYMFFDPIRSANMVKEIRKIYKIED